MIRCSYQSSLTITYGAGPTIIMLLDSFHSISFQKSEILEVCALFRHSYVFIMLCQEPLKSRTLWFKGISVKCQGVQSG